MGSFGGFAKKQELFSFVCLAEIDRKSDNKEEMEMLATRSPEMKKAVGVLKELSADERTRMLYEAREKARMDFESLRDDAVREAERLVDAKWQDVVANKDVEIAVLKAQLAGKE